LEGCFGAHHVRSKLFPFNFFQQLFYVPKA